jgi:hypothetical protein
MGRGGGPPGTDGDTAPAADSEAVRAIDAGIDSVLASFGIPEKDIRKQAQSPGGNDFSRTERRVSIGPEIVPVMVNAALNTMAHRYGARAVASENIRLKTVTIHLELGGAVIHTVILKIDPRMTPATGTPPQTST